MRVGKKNLADDRVLRGGGNGVQAIQHVWKGDIFQERTDDLWPFLGEAVGTQEDEPEEKKKGAESQSEVGESLEKVKSCGLNCNLKPFTSEDVRKRGLEFENAVALMEARGARYSR